VSNAVFVALIVTVPDVADTAATTAAKIAVLLPEVRTLQVQACVVKSPISELEKLKISELPLRIVMSPFGWTVMLILIMFSVYTTENRKFFKIVQIKFNSPYKLTNERNALFHTTILYDFIRLSTVPNVSKNENLTYYFLDSDNVFSS
jgi:hypothetical protein